ncbi:MgtC/SapB family protein [Sphingopyxis kveilinensis]|uniref:MgtC/SapB family protein n=1 Tax=Sphingopyxis kveilinensis TaxID=3114367 RepID=UPI0030D2DC1C
MFALATVEDLGRWPLLYGIALSLSLGFLIGIQRGWTLRNEAEGSRFAGIRTFGLIGLAGGIAGALEPIDRAAAILLLMASSLLVLLGYAYTARRRVSGTASLASLIALACGFLATSGQPQLASIVAVATTLLLTLRPQLHRWIATMTETEVSAIARFALIGVVILPLLPDKAMGPYNAWNPRQLWLVVVLVSGFSFVGYAAAKRFGATRGTLVVAAAGAMVSSTAVTAALATRLREKAENAPALIGGIAAASAVMLARVVILVAILAPVALGTAAMLIGPAALVSLAATMWCLLLARRAPPTPTEAVKLRNPLNFAPALGLTALVMAMALVARWLMEQVGEDRTAAILALSGIADVDAAIITIGGLPPGVLDGGTAGLVLGAAVMANTLFKAAIPPVVVRSRRGWIAALPLVASVVAGLAMLPWLL